MGDATYSTTKGYQVDLEPEGSLLEDSMEIVRIMDRLRDEGDDIGADAIWRVLIFVDEALHE